MNAKGYSSHWYFGTLTRITRINSSDNDKQPFAECCHTVGSISGVQPSVMQLAYWILYRGPSYSTKGSGLPAGALAILACCSLLYFCSLFAVSGVSIAATISARTDSTVMKYLQVQHMNASVAGRLVLDWLYSNVLGHQTGGRLGHHARTILPCTATPYT